MITVTLNSGETLEVCGADSYAGPGGCYGRQHSNSTVPWMRAPGGPWRRVRGVRSTHKASVAAGAHETAQEALEALSDPPPSRGAGS